MQPQYGPLQALTLIDDPEFLGYYVGVQYGKDNRPTGELHVSISQPGKSGLRGNVAIRAERLTAAGAPAAYSMAPKPKSKARVPAPEHAPANRP